MFSLMSFLAAANPPQDPSGNWTGLLLMGLVFAAMYFLLLRPQRKRQKEAQRLQSSLAEGDDVILNSGIYGFVSAVEDSYLWLDIAEKVEIRVARSAVASRVSSPAEGLTATEDKK